MCTAVAVDVPDELQFRRQMQSKSHVVIKALRCTPHGGGLVRVVSTVPLGGTMLTSSVHRVLTAA